MKPLADRENPWLGLAAYGESERAFFFGRARETAELMRLVEDESLVVLYAVSGLGKTSLLQAGLFPALRDHDSLPVLLRLYHDAENAAQRRDGGYQHETREVIARAAREAGAKGPAPHAAPGSLWEFFHHRDAQWWSPRNRLLTPVLVFDQFEEFFTLGAETALRRESSAAFLHELSDLIYNRVPASLQARVERGAARVDDYTFDPVRLRVVLSLREDFLPQLSELRERGFPTLLKAAQRLLPLGAEAARQCIEQPAPELLAPGVAASLVNFLAGAESVASASAAPVATTGRVATVEPALLSVVCRELNAERLRRGLAQINADLLTLSQEQILADFYERSWQGIALELRHFVEDELLTPGGFRDSRALDDALSRRGVTLADITQLIDRRLLHFQDRQDGPRRIELTHDLLSRVVRASRRRREEAERSRAAEEAKQRAEAEARATADRLAAAEAARAHEEQLRHDAERARGRARRLAVLSGILAAAAVVAGLFAANAARIANQQRRASEEVVRAMQYGTTLLQKASSLQGQYRSDDALQAYSEYLAHTTRLAEQHRGNPDLLRDVGFAYAYIGYVHQSAARYDQAMQAYQSELELAHRLVALQPDNPDRHLVLTSAYFNIGLSHQYLAHSDEALAAFREAVAIAQRFAPQFPDNIDWQTQLAYSYFSVGGVLQQKGQFADALKSYQDSVPVFQLLAKSDPTGWWRNYLASAYDSIAAVLQSSGRLEEAVQPDRDALAVRQQLQAEQPLNTQWQMNLSFGLRKLADALVGTGARAEARGYYQQAREIDDRLGMSDPANYWVQAERADTRTKLARFGDLESVAGRNQARQLLGEAVQILDRLKESPGGLQPLQASLLQEAQQLLTALGAPQ